MVLARVHFTIGASLEQGIHILSKEQDTPLILNLGQFAVLDASVNCLA